AQCFIGIDRPFADTRVHVIGEDGVATADLRLGTVAVVENTRWSPLFFKAADALATAGSIARQAGRGFVERLRRIPGGCATDGIDGVYDLSLGGGTTWQDYARDLVGGAENVAQVCLERGVRRLIYTSTIAALHLAADGAVDESAGTDRRPELRSWYVRGKI